DETSTAHNLDKDLSPIEAKSSEGFVFMIDLQVQIHVPDSDAPRVISTVGTMGNLVNEVLQAAVGNHFRDKLQSMPAIDFIQKRADVQQQAQDHITERLKVYRVETRGVYIQDVVFPKQLVEVLTAREIANQQRATYDAERAAQDQRLLLEASRGRADQQSALAQSMIGVDIARNRAAAVQAQADGEAYRLDKVGEASAVQTRAEGLAVAAGLEAQTRAVGAGQAAVINVAKALAGGTQRFMPENLAITGGGGDGLGIAPLLPQLMRFLQAWDKGSTPAGGEPPHEAPAEPAATQVPGAEVMRWAITPSVTPANNAALG
ncbi:MAG: SPFH domain-containing protein, partial [Nevskiales bacterium]